MAKKLLKRWMPDPAKIRSHASLQFMGTLLHDPNLFHLNRWSVSSAFLVGIFVCFLPVPGQMVLAAFGALWFRSNLPISVALVWISNPITMPPLFYACYRLGMWILGTTPRHFHFELSIEWITSELGYLLPPLLLGSLICAGIFSGLSYLLINQLWRWHVNHAWQKRIALRKSRNNPPS